MTTSTSFQPIPSLARELSVPEASVASVLKLLSDGNTVPFIARYRKEATGDLDEVQIRDIKERHTYLQEMEERRQTILTSIQEQGKLTDDLASKIRECTIKSQLEDLYLPFKPKRRTRATIARERGLLPLAQRILEQPKIADPLAEAAAYINGGFEVNTEEQALQGARDIVAEIIAEKAELRALARETLLKEAVLVTEVTDDYKDKPATKFEQYYNFHEPIAEIPSHRYLAIQRGEREEVLRSRIELEPEPLLGAIQRTMAHDPASPFGEHMMLAIKDSYKRLLFPSVETDVRVELKMRSDRAAVEIFASNLRNLLMASPLGQKSVIGIDPGIRTGCKCAAVDMTGKFLGHVQIFPHTGTSDLARSHQDFLAFLRKHGSFAIAIGNGTAGRETEAFVRQSLAKEGMRDLLVVSVSEAGASVYSASDVAREEFPDLDLTIRGAISIARRLQDPLAELVKIDPKAIGVGQYQHDVYQALLQRKLDEVVESCVNQVGVEVNTASAPLLSYVAGIGPSLAKKIVTYRELHGAFRSRQELLKVPGIGPRTFEQAAGFLRIRGGAHPLDSSAVHPERYSLVEQIAKDIGVQVAQLVENQATVAKIEIKRYISPEIGEPTLRDILSELQKPGRDPRTVFEAPKFREDVMTLEDLKQGMILEGVVTNVTAFGAFVDIGVHQDGLVHISELSDQYVKDPHEVAHVGLKLRVRVLDVDLQRRRISLSAKLAGIDAHPSAPSASASSSASASKRDKEAPPSKGSNQGGKPQGKPSSSPQGQKKPSEFKNNPFAGIFNKN